MPLELTQIIPENDSVRMLEDIINETSEKANYKWNSNHQNTAQAMMKIILYGFTSLRDIEKSCKRDINFKWPLQNEPAPSKSTIGIFIKDNGNAIEELFYLLVDFLNNKSEIDNKTVYVDGTKIEAYANKYTFVWRKAVLKYEIMLDEKTINFMQEINSEYSLDYTVEQIDEYLDYFEDLIERNSIKIVHGKGKRKTRRKLHIFKQT